jgi:Leucine Rich repeat
VPDRPGTPLCFFKSTIILTHHVCGILNGLQEAFLKSQEYSVTSTHCKRRELMAAVEGGVSDWRVELERVVREGEPILVLQNMFLGDFEAGEIAETLRTCHTVKTLELGWNNIGNIGAIAVAELLRSDSGATALEVVNLSRNEIDLPGVEALANALKENTTLRDLHLFRNPGVEPSGKGTRAQDPAGVRLIIAAISVNTSLEYVFVSSLGPDHPTIDRALADKEGRARGRERFLSAPLTKAARKTD